MVEILYIAFICSGMIILVIFPEELDTYNLFILWPERTKMQHVCQSLIKKVDSEHKYLRFPDLKHNNFEGICAAISSDNIDLVREEILRANPIGID